MSIEPPVRKMEFTPAIERQALKIVAKDNAFLVKWKGRLKADHFNEPHIQILFTTIEAYVEKYKVLPTIEAIYQHVKDHLGVYDVYQNFATYADALFHEEFHEDGQFVKDCLLNHMRAVDFDRFVLEAARLASDKEYGKIEGRLKEIVSRHTTVPPVDAYRSTLSDSVVERVKLERSVKAAIPTPWPTFNNKHGGGFHPSALSAFMGPTGSGKSILLVNTGAHCYLQGLTVYHFTFELSEQKTKARYDVCLTGCGYAERAANPALLDQTINALKNVGKLYVIQMSTGTCSANAVRSAIDDYALMGAPKPDVIILDYLTIMMPNDPENVDMKRDYAKLKVIAEEVRALAMDLNLPVITALQSNRGATQKEKIGKEDIADSYAVMHILDCTLSINQNEGEKQAGKLRLYAAKVRDYEDCYTIALEANYSNLRIKEDIVSTNNYNVAVQKMTQAAMANSKVGKVAVLPSALISPDSPDAGLDSMLGMALNPVKAKNAAVNTISQADAAQAQAWSLGHQPPPIVAPPAPAPTVPPPPV